MPKILKQELVSCQYFAWRLGRRDNGLFYGDGRSNHVKAGRHSLATKDRTEALAALRRLDMAMAVKFGLANPAILTAQTDDMLPLDRGTALYLEGVCGPAVLGGATKKTRQRYKAVFDKFLQFCVKSHIGHWQQVTTQTLKQYGAWLDDQGYKYRTEYLELNTLKQCVKWLVFEDYLSQTCLIKLKLRKPSGSPTYCYSPLEVHTIITHCMANQELHWLGRVVTTLAYSGVRIGELAQIEWADIELEAENGFIDIRDETRGGVTAPDEAVRTTKTHCSRHAPLHSEVRAMLASMPGPRRGRVFYGPRGGALKPDTVRTILHRDVLKVLKGKFPKDGAARSFEDGRVHSFRHFFCSYCFRHGIPETDIKDWLGHADSKMTAHYRHLLKGESESLINRIKPVGEMPATKEEV